MISSVTQRTPELPPDLQLGAPATDTMHTEFLQLLDLMDRATDDALLAAFDEWTAHTEHHFAQEESWMEATGFGPLYCHAGQHRHVLDVAVAVREKLANEGRFDLARRLVDELHEWFPHHVKTMDTMMVAHLREHGCTDAV